MDDKLCGFHDAEWANAPCTCGGTHAETITGKKWGISWPGYPGEVDAVPYPAERVDIKSIWFAAECVRENPGYELVVSDDDGQTWRQPRAGEGREARARRG